MLTLFLKNLMSQRVRIDHVVVLLQTYKEVKSPQLKQAHLVTSNGNYDAVTVNQTREAPQCHGLALTETYTYL